MRNWNSSATETRWTPTAGFWSYLWGIETEIRYRLSPRTGGFDRTYEELKLKIRNCQQAHLPLFWSYLWGIETYPVQHPGKDRIKRSWSYLWGIETPPPKSVSCSRCRFDRTYEELKPQPLSAPNRFDLVLIVPMRNWNAERSKHMNFDTPCFDRTYEELKLAQGRVFHQRTVRFDRTYEGSSPNLCVNWC